MLRGVGAATAVGLAGCSVLDRGVEGYVQLKSIFGIDADNEDGSDEYVVSVRLAGSPDSEPPELTQHDDRWVERFDDPRRPVVSDALHADLEREYDDLQYLVGVCSPAWADDGESIGCYNVRPRARTSTRSRSTSASARPRTAPPSRSTRPTASGRSSPPRTRPDAAASKTLLPAQRLDASVSEYGFELSLCAHLERERDGVLARQLGGGVHAPGNRVLDVVHVEPGPGLDERAAITERRIPDPAIRGPAGPGRARPWRDALPDGLRDENARRIADACVDRGFFERERRGSREYLRQTARYPDDWFGRVLAVENKPDLGTPGALERQLRLDVSLALVDEVVLATESHVTGAHLNRIPSEVGVWRYHPESDALEVVREPEPLAVEDSGVELLDEQPARTDVAVVDADEKRGARRRLAERAYGKGWRTYDLPGCERVTPDASAVADHAALPYCAYHDRVVDPARDCGVDCPGHRPTDAPDVDLAAERDAHGAWVRDPDGRRTRQSGLDAFE